MQGRGTAVFFRLFHAPAGGPTTSASNSSSKMKRELRDLLLLVCFSSGITVMMDHKSEPDLEIDEDSGDFQSTLGACLAKKIHGTFECVNRGTLSVLRSLNSEDILDFEGMKLERAEGQSRDLLDLDYDPKDFGNVVHAAARLMERRNLKWDLSNVYPGLQMRVGPMLNGNGVLEFVVDERFNGYSDRQLGTGRMLMRSLVLPFLLGFKFSLASLIPLVFGVLLLVTKKALLLTKVALLLSGLLGWNSILTGGQGYPGGHSGTPQNFFPHGLGGFGLQNSHGYNLFGGAAGGLPHHDHHDLHYPFRPYRTAQQSPDFPSYGQHIVREVVNVYETENEKTDHNSPRDGKNFVWSPRD